MAHWVPHREEAHDEHGGEDEDDVGRMHADRVGVEQVAAFAAAEAYDAVLLLNEAEGETHRYADDGADEAYHAAFDHEDVAYLLVAGTEVAERDDILLLVDDEHGQRAYDVEAGYHEDERKEDVGDELLDLHDLERVLLLLIAVEHQHLVAKRCLHLLLHCLEVGTALQSQLDGRDIALPLEQATGEGYWGNDVVGVVLALTNHESHLWRVQLFLIEALAWVGKVDALSLAWGIDLYG